MKQRFAVVVLLLLGTALVFGQASRIPGGDYSVPLGAEARNGRMVFQTADGSFRWWFDARLQMDAAFYFNSKNPMSDGTVFRRLTFAMKTVLWKDWETELDVDFAEAVLDLRDMWLKYRVPGTHLSLQVGNFKEPFGLERLTSSLLLTFLERSSVSNAFPLGRRMGAAARYWTKYGQLTGAIMGHEAGTRIDKGTRDEGYSTNVRLTLAPINQHGKNLHIGGAFAYKIPDAVADLPENTIEIKARHETYVSDPKLLHTGDLRDVNYYLRSGVELLGIYGPLFLQSEAMWTSVERWYNKPRVDMKGGYAFLTWMVTGETRDYYIDEGEPGPVEMPKHSWGALELAARASFLDLNDLGAGIHGGYSKQLMLGVNYYPNRNIKLQFNYSAVDLDQYATRKGNMLGDDDHWFIQFRVQAAF
ncbi:MAG: porin [bacterium]|jgi:phosphate-selective porin OprO/OprP|nr:porin [candidate division KSB1 bacterium]MDH7560626.1 porin [bacterium]